MKIKYLVLTFSILFLAFVCIWVLSPRVGETVVKEEGQEITFEDDLYNVPDKLPDGFVRYNAVSDAVVYKYVDANNKVYFYEYIGNEQYAPYDINKPSYFVKTSFDKRIYQIKDANGNLLDQYRAYDGTVWQIVTKEYKILMEIPKNYYILSTPNLFYIENEDKTISYKLLTYINGNYAWLSPVDNLKEWVPMDVPETFKKTEVYNVYYNEEMKLYKKVIKFNDINKTITAVNCDKDGNYIP